MEKEKEIKFNKKIIGIIGILFTMMIFVSATPISVDVFANFTNLIGNINPYFYGVNDQYLHTFEGLGSDLDEDCDGTNDDSSDYSFHNSLYSNSGMNHVRLWEYDINLFSLSEGVYNETHIQKYVDAVALAEARGDMITYVFYGTPTWLADNTTGWCLESSPYEYLENYVEFQHIMNYTSAWMATNTNLLTTSCLQYYFNGTCAVSLTDGYYSNAFGALTFTNGNKTAFEGKLNSSLDHFAWGGLNTYDWTDCYGVYQGSRPAKSLAYGLGLDVLSYVGEDSSIHQILNRSASGFNSQTWLENYYFLVDNFFNSDFNVTQTYITGEGKIGIWIPWMDSSTSCEVTNLKSYGSVSSPTFTNNVMVSDEYSEIGILLSMSNNETRFEQWYNTLYDMKSSYGSLNVWVLSRDGNIITHESTDTASDANVRIANALYFASDNPNFINNSLKESYETLANNIMQDHIKYESKYQCETSDLTGNDICNWLGGGRNAVNGGFASDPFIYTGYYGDSIKALINAYQHTKNRTYAEVASEYIDQYLISTNYSGGVTGNSFKVSPFNFRWNMGGTNPEIYAGNSYHFNPIYPQWDDSDAPRTYEIADISRILNFTNMHTATQTAEANISMYQGNWASCSPTNLTKLAIVHNYIVGNLTSATSEENLNIITYNEPWHSEFFLNNLSQDSVTKAVEFGKIHNTSRNLIKSNYPNVNVGWSMYTSRQTDELSDHMMSNYTNLTDFIGLHPYEANSYFRTDGGWTFQDYVEDLLEDCNTFSQDCSDIIFDEWNINDRVLRTNDNYAAQNAYAYLVMLNNIPAESKSLNFKWSARHYYGCDLGETEWSGNEYFAQANEINGTVDMNYNVTKNFATYHAKNSEVYTSSTDNSTVKVISTRKGTQYGITIINTGSEVKDISLDLTGDYPYESITNAITGEVITMSGNIAELGNLNAETIIYLSGNPSEETTYESTSVYHESFVFKDAFVLLNGVSGLIILAMILGLLSLLLRYKAIDVNVFVKLLISVLLAALTLGVLLNSIS